MLAEWGHPEKAKAIGFMADFIFQFGKEGYRDLFFNETGVYRRDTCYFDRRGLGNASRFINTLNECLKATGDDAYICIPTGNHDIQRLNCGNRKSKEELEVAMTFLLTQPAIPCIYYGDEIGMQGYSDPFSRQCFEWDNKNIDLKVWYSMAVALRKSSLAFSKGDFQNVYKVNSGYGFMRSYKDDMHIVLTNFSDNNECFRLDLARFGVRELELENGLFEEYYNSEDGIYYIQMSGCEAKVFKCRK